MQTLRQPAPRWTVKMEKSPRASPRSRQQCRPGSPGPEKENAARGRVSGDEIAAQLREALGAPRPRKGRGGAPLPQAPAQAHGARRVLTRPPKVPAPRTPPVMLRFGAEGRSSNRPRSDALVPRTKVLPSEIGEIQAGGLPSPQIFLGYKSFKSSSLLVSRNLRSRTRGKIRLNKL